uniref:Uncharacterized protein n=1 Tax=Rousettus aegyptiacus TaxID=9407 RepID=A0A7J8E8N5_ROUAE|nr:hypothetical protein HJG63_008251 [Rousettus aegyptiacus]
MRGRSGADEVIITDQAQVPHEDPAPEAPRSHAEQDLRPRRTWALGEVSGALPEFWPLSGAMGMLSMGLLAKNNGPKTWGSEGSSQSQKGDDVSTPEPGATRGGSGLWVTAQEPAIPLLLQKCHLEPLPTPGVCVCACACIHVCMRVCV